MKNDRFDGLDWIPASEELQKDLGKGTRENIFITACAASTVIVICAASAFLSSDLNRKEQIGVFAGALLLIVGLFLFITARNFSWAFGRFYLLHGVVTDKRVAQHGNGRPTYYVDIRTVTGQTMENVECEEPVFYAAVKEQSVVRVLRPGRGKPYVERIVEKHPETL